MKGIIELARQPQAKEASVSYLSGHMSAFLKKGEKVLICLNSGPDTLGSLICSAVEKCGAEALVWGPDCRWKTLLRQAFENRVHTIVGTPLVVLGLAKLARAKSTPLYIRNVVTVGYPCMDWMVDGIINCLDCCTWGCLDYQESCVVAGFSCGKERGVHLRDEEYGVKLVDAEGKEVAKGERGEILLYHKSEPQMLYPLNDSGRLDFGSCECASAKPRLCDIAPGPRLDENLLQAGQEIMRWTSVLDCCIKKGPAGLEIEIVVFPGEKLPKLPSCAKLKVRPWDPENDVPFDNPAGWKIQ